MSIYDIQQAYDVADMVKQYFRELPDMLLTAKMSETFMAIFQRKLTRVRYIIKQNAVVTYKIEHFRFTTRRSTRCCSIGCFVITR